MIKILSCVEWRITPSTILFGDGFLDYKVGIDTTYHEDESIEYRVLSHIKPILGRTKVSDVYLGTALVLFLLV